MIQVSIIIPSYNTCRLLINCLSSILKTTKIPFEIIVVDNGSTDGTIKEIKQLKDKIKNNNLNLKIIENKENLGFAKAINQGLKEAKGEFFLLLNSDTLILDSAIDKAVEFLKNRQNVGAVGCQFKNPNGSIQPSGGYLPNLINIFFWMNFLDDLPIIKKFFPAYHVMDKDFYLHQQDLGWVTGAFFLIKKETFNKVGFFDEKMFMYVEEVDWCTRVKKAGFKVVFTPKVSIIHYKGASTRRGRGGILEEYQGLKYYFAKYKPWWQMIFLRFFLKFGALVRILLFGIILQDKEAKRIYEKAFLLA